MVRKATSAPRRLAAAKAGAGSKRPSRQAKNREKFKPPISNDSITKEYNLRLRNANSLAEEISFILRHSIEECNIKVHEIDARVKDLKSTINKIRDKEYSNIDEVGDLIGGRVVCLFRTDLQKIRLLIEERFQVDHYDDKLFSDPDSFGYMSLHFECRLRQDCSGPRYDAIKNIPFELQLRTIGMHAWAAVSHYVGYKGDWDVPKHLKKDLNALSGLFYVADTQFEAVYEAKIKSTKAAEINAASNEIDDELINLDTLKAYMRARFPDRNHADSSAISQLVHELTSAGYSKIGEIAKDVDRAEEAFQKYDLSHSALFADIGATRLSLALSSSRYRGAKYGDTNMFNEYLALVKPNIE